MSGVFPFRIVSHLFKPLEFEGFKNRAGNSIAELCFDRQFVQRAVAQIRQQSAALFADYLHQERLSEKCAKASHILNWSHWRQGNGECR